jgi:membrane protease YdiL (CAAX protease family)
MGRWRRWGVLVFAMAFPTAMAWIYFVQLGQPAATRAVAPTHGDLSVVLAYGVAKAVQFALPVMWIWFFAPESLSGLRPRFRGLGLGLAFGLATAALVLTVYFGSLRGSDLLSRTPLLVREKVAQFGAATPLRFVALAVFISAVHSLLEEYYWRWFVFGELKKELSLGAAIFLSSLSFTGHHVIVLAMYFPSHLLTATIPFAFAVGIGGATWAWLYHRSGSIYSPWLSHLLVDVAIMVVGYDMIFGGLV